MFWLYLVHVLYSYISWFYNSIFTWYGVKSWVEWSIATWSHGVEWSLCNMPTNFYTTSILSMQNLSCVSYTGVKEICPKKWLPYCYSDQLKGLCLHNRDCRDLWSAYTLFTLEILTDLITKGGSRTGALGAPPPFWKK